MKKITKKIARNRRTKRIGPQLIEAVSQLRDALRSGEQIENRFTARTVEIPEPKEYGLEQIKNLRARLSMSQAVFASISGVSAELVENWEQGRSVPKPWARRLMDFVGQNQTTVTQTVRLRAARPAKAIRPRMTLRDELPVHDHGHFSPAG